MAKVDHPVIDERSAIVDADYGRAPVPEIGDAHFRSKRKRAVSCRHRAASVNLTIGGAVAIKTGAIPTGFTSDDLHHLRYNLQLRFGELRGRRCKDRFDLRRRKGCLQLRGLRLDHQIQRVKRLCTVEREEITRYDRQDGCTA